MASTVIKAFEEFQDQHINLDKDINDQAKASRDWLMDRIADFSGTEGFATLYPDIHMPYGSFARKTKIPALDDIDQMVGINARGCTYDASRGWNNVFIYVPTSNTELSGLCHDRTNQLNSRKVINCFVSKLADVPQYSKADIKRNGEACVLNLTSYPWKFDIVPCFQTTENIAGKSYYLIPNGEGNWMMTDPRIDKKYASDINQKHNGYALPLIRFMKFWIKRQGVPAMKSYLLETMLLQYFAGLLFSVGAFPDITLPDLFNYISKAAYYNIADPKGIVPNINDLSTADRATLSAKAAADYKIALNARAYEKAGDMAASIAEWTKIFGSSFPTYS